MEQIKQWKLFKLCLTWIFSPSEYLINFYFCCRNPRTLNFIYGNSRSNSYLIVCPINEMWQVELIFFFLVEFFIVIAFLEILVGSKHHFLKIKSATSFNFMATLSKVQIKQLYIELLMLKSLENLFCWTLKLLFSRWLLNC